MTLGEKITKLRKEHQYTQEQLAEKLSVSRQAVGKWESDLTFPETEKLIVMSDLFDCSLDYLLKEEQGLPMKETFAQTNKNTKAFEITIRFISEYSWWFHLIIFICSFLVLFISMKLFWNMGIYVDEHPLSSITEICGGDFWLNMDWIRLFLLFGITLLSGIQLFVKRKK